MINNKINQKKDGTLKSKIRDKGNIIIYKDSQKLSKV